jgi:hypothetical protein
MARKGLSGPRQPPRDPEISDQATRVVSVRPDASRFNQQLGNSWRRQRASVKLGPGAVWRLPSLPKDELARATAEIEKASEALREREPAMDHGVRRATMTKAPRAYWSIWLVIALVWITTVVLVSATAGILYLLR